MDALRSISSGSSEQKQGYAISVDKENDGINSIPEEEKIILNQEIEKVEENDDQRVNVSISGKHTFGGWYSKVGYYHNYATERLRKRTSKKLLFNAAISNNSFDNPLLQSLIAPKSRDNLIYDVHMYPPSLGNMLFFKLSAFLIRDTPIYLGEFNSNYIEGTLLSKDQLTQYLKLFHQFNIFGWAIWRWYYSIDNQIPAFNLTSDNGKIRPNTNFSNLAYAIEKVYHDI